jgi:hypothetical protein
MAAHAGLHPDRPPTHPPPLPKVSRNLDSANPTQPNPGPAGTSGPAPLKTGLGPTRRRTNRSQCR